MGNPSRRGVLAGAAALALAPTIAKAADEFDPALVAAAKKEGKGTYYGVSDTIVAGAVINGFKARFGIPLEFERLIAATDDPALLSRYASARLYFVQAGELIRAMADDMPPIPDMLLRKAAG